MKRRAGAARPCTRNTARSLRPCRSLRPSRWLGNPRNKRVKTLAVLLAAGIAAWAALARAQQNQNFDNVQIHTLHVNKNVYVLVGAGGNITLQAGPEGVLLVDTMFDPLASKIMTEVRKLSSLPVRFIINTSADADPTGGNEVLAVSGARSASQRVIGAAGVAT